MAPTKQSRQNAEANRQAVLDVIKASPNGIYNSKIAELTGFNHQLVSYYLAVLRMRGKVTFEGGRFDRLYFATGR